MNKSNNKSVKSSKDKAKREYVKPEVKLIPLKFEERLMACLKFGGMNECLANIKNS